MTENEIDAILNAVLASMLQNHPEINISVSFSDDLYNEAMKVCENETYRHFLVSQSEAEIAQCNEMNGCYIIPKDLGSKQYVVISSKQLSDGYSFISTAAHETQHAINHTEFCQQYCNGRFEEIYNHRYNIPFQIWDEFAARRTGHRMYVTVILQKILGYSVENIIEELLNIERSARIAEISELKETPLSVEQFKKISAILAKFSVWESEYDIPPDGLDEWSMRFLRCLDCYNTVRDVKFQTLDTQLTDLKCIY